MKAYFDIALGPNQTTRDHLVKTQRNDREFFHNCTMGQIVRLEGMMERRSVCNVSFNNHCLTYLYPEGLGGKRKGRT